MNTNTHYAPEHLREAFAIALEKYFEWKEGPEPRIWFGIKYIPIKQLCRRFLACSDQLPSHLCELMDGTGFEWENPAHSTAQGERTYGSAARFLYWALISIERIEPIRKEMIEQSSQRQP